MPLVRVELTDAYSQETAISVGNAIHSALVEIFGIPESDKFQILHRNATGSLVAEDAGLGFQRSLAMVIIQIFTQRGRSAVMKSALYAEIANRLGEMGVEGEDIFIGYHENGPEDWSFGFGRAQYLTGELSVPKTA